ncbi:uncharacterized protein LOC100907896 [Galendromus occidentalis]|uniref:Uncharacterized protein LOC100907896 n=1 Tax=Galendromus occidentalis TaxID=34638 RepID=A0AAJ6VZC1_9ACAR|nr:uncharacterized protein LOC100907896 [Galendromus occidentalis]
MAHQLPVIFIISFLFGSTWSRCPNVAPPEYPSELGQFFTRNGLRVNLVHVARSNADDEELYDSVCLEASVNKKSDNQYFLNYTYKQIKGFVNVTLFDGDVPDDEARLVQLVPEGNLLAAVQCNPQERIHVFLGLIKNVVGSSCRESLRTVINRAHLAAGFRPVKKSERELSRSIAQCCATH